MTKVGSWIKIIHMKKLVTPLILSVLALSICGCGSTPNPEEKKEEEKQESEKKFDTISILGEMIQKEYTENSEWNLNGLNFYAYNSGTFVEVLSYDKLDITFSPEIAVKGTTKVAVTAKFKEDQAIIGEKSFDVTVKENTKKLVSLEIAGQLTKTEYKLDESWSADGLTINGIYNDSSKEALHKSLYDLTFNPVAPSLDTKKLSIMATLKSDSSKNATKQFDVSVTKEEKVLSSIKIEGTLAKTAYTDGDNWETGGLSVKGTYEDGSTGVISPSLYTFEFSPANASLGVSQVTITAKMKSSSISSSPVNFSVTVKEKGGGEDDRVKEYYKNISTTATGDTLKSALYNLLVRDHEKYSYDALEVAMRTTDRNWALSPDPNDENPYMNLLYMVDNSSSNKVHKWNTYHGSGGIIDGSAVWDKEHIWAKANGFSTKSLPAYSDLHHLRASDMRNNNNRSNLPYGPCSSGKYVTDFNGDNSGRKGTTYEPIDRDKGDIARALFYMATRYSTGDGSGGTKLSLTNGTDSSGGKWGYLSTLLTWHRNDPPDAWEIARNGLVQDVQGNRNPFIDHPEWVSKIWSA